MKSLGLPLSLEKDLATVRAATAEMVKKASGSQSSQLVTVDVLEANLRPALVFLSARLCGQPAASVLPVATAVQAIFLAGVIHLRAGKGEVAGNELKTAILLGDYLYSSSFRVLADAGLQQLLAPLSRVVCAESEAAVGRAGDPALDPETVKKETAILIGECCRLPGLLAGVGFVEELNDFGINLGMAHGYLQRRAPAFQAAGYVEAAEAALLKLPAVPARRQLKRVLDLVARNGAGAQTTAALEC